MPTRKSEPTGSLIAAGLKVAGDLRTQQPLTVLGVLDGNVETAASLHVGEGGRVRGDVQARDVAVEGRIDGNLTVEDRVELKLTGRIRGDITAPRVSMVEGAFFRGRLRTSGARGAPRA